MGNQGKIEINYLPFLKQFYAYRSLKTSSPPIETNSTHISSGDIGIKRYLVNYIRNAQNFAIVYPSDHVFQEYIDQSHRIFQFQQTTKNESHLYSPKRIRRLFVKRKRKIINYMNNAIANFFRIFQVNHVSKLIVGELSHIRAALLPVYFKNKEKLNMMIHNFWAFHLLLCKLHNKCEELGLEFEQIKERR
ncbi:MAG: hypothetical protein ACFFD2_08740, partial [Promethearchaeota archaeon]